MEVGPKPGDVEIILIPVAYDSALYPLLAMEILTRRNISAVIEHTFKRLGLPESTSTADCHFTTTGDCLL